MDRATWLREQRLKAEADYDTRYSATYDADAEPMTTTHRRFVRRVVRASPVSGTVLDAACGTGKYFGIVTAAGRKPVGADQSAGMLDVARAKFPAVELVRSSLQELDLERTFDGVMCVDAMENVPPEDWPGVLANLHRALKPDGLLYLTVEEHEQADIDAGYADAVGRGLPVVPGEHTFGGTAYHFMPTRPQVSDWIAAEGLSVIDEANSLGDGYSYWHLLMRQEVAEEEQPPPS
jgi:ubiquinone/menaquinone biosynthesis C-methylase UbiE